jgi:hypothetical protein
LKQNYRSVDQELMVYFGDCKAHNVGTDAVRKYIAQRLEEGAANASINRELESEDRTFLLLQHRHSGKGRSG